MGCGPGDPMEYELRLQYLASGCPTRCRHCGAIGGKGAPMPMERIETILREVAALKERNPDATIYDTPMFEVMAHPDPAGVFRRRADVLGDLQFPGISSSGVPIGTREDWRPQLEELKELGVGKFYLTVHGPRDINDRYVALPGAFAAVETAVRRIHEVGLTCGTNVYLNTDALAQFPALLDDLQKAGFDEYYFGIALFYPHARMRRYERSRPTLRDLEPHVETIKRMDKHPVDTWDSLSDYTEASWVKQALSTRDEPDENRWTEPYDLSNIVELATLGNLDVHDGDLSYPGTRYGNVESGGLITIVARAEEAKRQGTFLSANDARNFFGVTSFPPVSQLAHDAGDGDSQKIHLHPMSIRNRWLDRAFADHRVL